MQRDPDRIAAAGEESEDADALFEMANFSPQRTGLPFVVWISPDARVKVSPGPKALPCEMISVAIRPAVRVVEGRLGAGDLALLAKRVELNRDVLTNYWDGEIEYTEDAIAAIRAI